jgi:hypothetical protein
VERIHGWAERAGTIAQSDTLAQHGRAPAAVESGRGKITVVFTYRYAFFYLKIFSHA